MARYSSDPGTFFDVSISPGSTYTSLTISLCGIEPRGSIKWWNPITLAYEPSPTPPPAQPWAAMT
jgi:hypothetical protein